MLFQREFSCLVNGALPQCFSFRANVDIYYHQKWTPWLDDVSALKGTKNIWNYSSNLNLTPSLLSAPLTSFLLYTFNRSTQNYLDGKTILTFYKDQHLKWFQLVLMDTVYHIISVSLFKIHKTKCTLSNGKINQIIYIQPFPRCLKETSAALMKKWWVLCWLHVFSLSVSKYFLKGKKSLHGAFLFQQNSSLLCTKWHQQGKYKKWL